MGEIHRLQHRLTSAEERNRDASRFGCDPLPGLALLRLAQGEVPAAAAMIRRAVAECLQPLARAALLPAYVGCRPGQRSSDPVGTWVCDSMSVAALASSS